LGADENARPPFGWFTKMLTAPRQLQSFGWLPETVESPETMIVFP